MQSNRLEKIVVSVGLGRMRSKPQFEDKVVPDVMEQLALITGQKPAARAAKKSIASFKVRQGETVGVVVTLRGSRMQSFFKKIINVVLPRVRDFHGIKTSQFDGRGNVSIGFKDQSVFPEINPETAPVDFGLEITLVADTKSKEEGIEFFKSLGLPLEKN
jgi:large subunit ribosomal protein L5